MSYDYYKQIVNDLLLQADVRLNGDRAWDIKVTHPKFYKRVLLDGSLGFGEAYMDGWFSCDRLDVCMEKILDAHLDTHLRRNLKTLSYILFARFFNLQSKKRSYIVGKRHYDVGNDLYAHMLDHRMVYTCGYWKDAKTLDEAQEDKLELVCKKIGLKKGMTLLDIGCGWGSFVEYAARKYGVRCVGITISKEQVTLAKERCKGLPVEIRLQDYRDVNEKFDRIISLGMFEHVGSRNYRTYMEVVHRLLRDDGLFLLHTIGGNHSVFLTDPWIHTYIFPNSQIPSVNQVARASEGLFVMEDWHNFGPDYDKTLMSWHSRFKKSWPKLKEKYDDCFFRMWEYYLLVCAASFRARRNQLWQIVFSKKGVKGGYQSIR